MVKKVEEAERQRRLAALRDCESIAAAAQVLGISPSTLSEWRRNDAEASTLVFNAGSLTDRECLDTLKAYHASGGIKTSAAAKIKIPLNTFASRLRTAQARFPDWQPEEVAVAALPAKDLPFEERLELMKRRTTAAIEYKRAQAWQKVHIPISGPYGICWFGDPHLDDPYCDITSFERHAKICADTPGMFGVNGGDTLNNWVGRLKALYAEQPTTAEEGWELADWALNGLGVRWAAWLLGNHDVWEMGFRIFEKMNTRRVLMRDWEAKLIFVSECGGECRVWTRHDFKGSSIYNELHGQKRAAMFSGGVADIYAAFHRHTIATGKYELDSGEIATLIRARGYKDSDSYAMKNGFTEQVHGQSVVTVITPNPGGRPSVETFWDVAEGAEYLTFKRQRAGLA